MSKKRTGKSKSIDVDLVKQAAAGRWPEILSQVAGIDVGVLDGRHHPCPKCGGTDRFRMIDQAAGGCLCNQCLTSKNGDGLAVVQWSKGVKFPESLNLVARYLGIEANGGGSRSARSAKIDDGLEWQDWNDNLVGLWCLKKPPITPAAVAEAGGRLAIYWKKYPVIAFPVRGSDGDPVGWLLYNRGGRGLPKGKGDAFEWVRCKLTYGSKAGIIGDLAAIAEASILWKLEGLPDLLTWLSLPDRPPGLAAFTNANGATERPPKWVCKLATGKKAIVVHDADQPGQKGAVGWTENGRRRPGWCDGLAATAESIRNVGLPFEIEPDHGKDFRDWVNLKTATAEPGGNTWPEMLDLAVRSPLYEAPAAAVDLDVESETNEAEDDPHRLARVNLERYATATNGRTLRYWRGEWFTWKRDRYRRTAESDLKAKINAAVRDEFVRLNKAAVEHAKQNNADEDDQVIRKVSRSLVSNVIEATAGMSIVPAELELNTWIATREKRNLVAMRNGLVDLDAVLADADAEDCILPHSPQWFSLISLPYDFDPMADCPRWKEFLQFNQEGDADRIAILQEWAGYLLTPDTGQQKFLLLEGEGSNGKSVYLAGITAMIGADNCSFVPLECFGDRFSKTSTLGRLVNISADAGDLDKPAEGHLKSFTSGDPMQFDRKGLAPIEALPTARLIIAANNRPRFTDRSDGVYRRMMPVPWRVKVDEGRRILNMDKADWWNRKGNEVSGIFNWALLGLARLRRQKEFTKSKVVNDNLADYRCEMNPAKVFLQENVEIEADGVVTSNKLYSLYCAWIKENGYRPLAERQFFKEVKRRFPQADKRRGGERKNRFWYYDGIKFSQSEICGEQTDENF